jgi:uncharacterized protein YqjF (DUF2071 family)
MKRGTELDRLAMRTRPEGSPIMHQTWQNLLFLHWPVDPALLRPLIPTRLAIDTYDGKAWIGVTPFAMTNVHLTSLPAIPGLDSLFELNVRTYVHHDGIPGVWFFSLDASKLIPVMAARILFMLPYYKAEMVFAQDGEPFQFEARRIVGPAAEFEARWKTGIRLRDPDLESLAFFLAERYCLYAGDNEALAMTRIYHHPWILDEVTELEHRSSMISALSLPEPAATPLPHFARSLNVEIWEPAPV